MSTAFLETLNGWLSGGANRPQTHSGAMKFSNLDHRVQKHLSRVYMLLAMATATAAIGCYAHIALGISGILTQVGAFASLIALNFMANVPSNQHKRLACLGGFAFCQGAALGPLVDIALAIQPTAVLLGFTSTSAVFVAFSLSALLTQRRAYMYLGGWLSAATMALLVLRLGSLFTGASQALFSVELYGGLLMFAAYILYDTQLIVERASAGEMDEVRHALDLLVDFIGVFVRVLIILIKNQEREAERRRKDERRR